MTNIISTKAGQKSVKTSSTNLNLNVTSEDEFKGVYEGFRAGMAKTSSVHKLETKKLGDTARKNLWHDLGAALAVCDVLMAEENAEWLFEALDSHGIRVVEDPAKANEFVPLVRLLMGYWKSKPKDWKAGDPEPEFDWDRRIEKYAKVLRAAKHLKLTPQGLVDRLTSDKGLTKLQKEDDKRNLANDTEEQERLTRFKAVTNDTPKSTITADGFGLPAKDRPSMVALWATVSADGQTLNILGKLPTSVDSITSHINRVSKELYPEIQRRRLEEENAQLRSQLASQQAGYTVSDRVKAINLGNQPEAVADEQAA